MRNRVGTFLVLVGVSAASLCAVEAFAAGGTMLGSPVTYRDHMPVGGGFKEKKSTRYRTAQALMASGKYYAAIQVLRRIAADEPRNDAVWNDLGYASQKLGRYGDAAAYYEQALSINPQRRDTRAHLGEVLLALNNLNKAQEQLDQLKQICASGCQEAQALEAQITAYRAAHPA